MQQPIGPVRGAIEFVWSTPTAAPSYRLQVRDASGAVLFTIESSASRAALPTALRERLEEGKPYSWYVEALDHYGAVVVGSDTASFTIQP